MGSFRLPYLGGVRTLDRLSVSVSVHVTRRSWVVTGWCPGGDSRTKGLGSRRSRGWVGIRSEGRFGGLFQSQSQTTTVTVLDLCL